MYQTYPSNEQVIVLLKDWGTSMECDPSVCKIVIFWKLMIDDQSTW